MPLVGNYPRKSLLNTISYYNGSLYAFGYSWRVNSPDYNGNNLFAYSLDNFTWSVVNAGDIRPEPRIGHSSYVYNHQLFMFFGTNLESEQPYPDIWKFNFLSSKWVFLGVKAANFIWGHGEILVDSTVYQILGRNIENVMNSVIALDLSQEIPSFTTISPSWTSPAKRKNHCSVTINDQILIFGGVSENGVHMNDVWKYDITKDTWNYITTSGSVPNARELFGCDLYEGRGILIFGGTDGTTIFNDLYYYDDSERYWTVYVSQNTGPSGRYNLCICASLDFWIIIGGQDKQQAFDEIWMYSYSSQKYFLVNEKDTIKPQLISHKCWLSYNNDSVVYIVGGMSYLLQPNQYLYQITLNSNNQVFTTSTTVLFTSSYLSVSEFDIVTTANFVYLLYGSFWNYYSIKNITVFNFETKEVSTFEVSGNMNFYGHSASHYADSIYVFGGGVSVDSVKQNNLVTNGFFKLKITSDDSFYLNCSEGTIGDDCTPCSWGTIAKSGACEPCPPGTFSTSIASISFSQCFPCNYGEFSDKLGAYYCLQCESDAFCPIGSTKVQQDFYGPSYESYQPSLYESNTSFISNLIENLWILACSIMGFIVLVAIIIPKLKKTLEIIDIFSAKHRKPLNIPIVHKRTVIGGYFSIFFILFSIITIIGGFLTYQTDNINELKSLIPIVALNHTFTAEKLDITITFYVYGGSCIVNSICQSEILESGFVFSQKSIKCIKENENCKVFVSYLGFSMKQSSTISINMQEASAYANIISVNMSCSSSIPNEISGIFLSYRPSSGNYIFKGLSPSIVAYEFIPSVLFIQVFTSESGLWPSLETGYHVASAENTNLGSLASQTT